MGGGRFASLQWQLRRLVLPVLLWRLQGVAATASSGPIGTVSALATQTRQYSSTVAVAYVDPVNCTVQFDQDVVNFGAGLFWKDPDTRIFNVEQIQPSSYRFQVASLSSANVTIYIPTGTVRNAAGQTNNDTTAFFNFHFYAYPPAATIRLDGYQAQSTAVLPNLAYLVFNSTTEFDGRQHFNSSMLSMSPSLQITNFRQVSGDTFRFNFVIEKNYTPEASNVFCLDTSNETMVNNTLSDGQTAFRCSLCDRPLFCVSNSLYPPSGISAMEFPLQVVLDPVPALGLARTSLPVLYDTLWAHVTVEAPYFAKGPFNVTITWTEPMRDLTRVLPTFSGAGPVQALPENIVTLSPTSFRMLVVPSQTGILTVLINGTQDSADMAGNSNDFRRNPETRTGDQLIVVFSAGPPAAGSVSTAYDRPTEIFEYGVTAPTSTSNVPSLRVSWTGFLTATYYSVWVTWGQNLSTPVARQPGPLLGEASCGSRNENCTDTYTFMDFRALFGVEYTVYVRASNLWGDEISVSKTFLHPKLSAIADGTYQVLSLPQLLSREETNVDFRVQVPQQAFLSMNPLKVLSISSANRSAGDKDPCLIQTAQLRCTPANLRIEVPASQFVVFKEPIRLQLNYRAGGWTDPNFQPQLRYWEAYQEEWRPAAPTCPADKVHENWDRVNNIYSVSFCHLTQFAVFETYSPPAVPTPAPEAARPGSYEDPIFFIALAGAVVVIVMVCCIWYFVCIRPGQAAKSGHLNFSEFGIRPVALRLGGGGGGHQRVSPLEQEALDEEVILARRSSRSSLRSGQRNGRRQSQDESKQLMALPEAPAQEAPRPQPQPQPQGPLQQGVPRASAPAMPPPPPPPHRPPSAEEGAEAAAAAAQVEERAKMTRRMSTENLPEAPSDAPSAPSLPLPPPPPVPPASRKGSMMRMESVGSLDEGAV